MLAAIFYSFATAQTDTSTHPFQLGHAYDLSTLDLWGFTSGYVHHDVLSWPGTNLPSDCATKNENCVPTFDTKIDEYNDIKSIFDHFSFQISGGLSVTYKGITASISGAFGRKSSNSWFSNDAAASSNTQNMQTCHSLANDCLYNIPGAPDELTIDPVFNYTIQQMATSKYYSTNGTDTDVLEMWSENVISQSGTHLCIRTHNGAAIKTFTYSNIAGSSQAQCAYQKVCLTLKAQGTLPVSGSANLCEKTEGCSNGTNYDAKWGSNCVGVGGDPKLSPGVCDSSTPASDRDTFLSSGDLDSSTSVIAMNFMPLNELLSRFGYSENVVNTMEQAIDYHLCKAKFETGLWEWDTNGEDGGHCQCTRVCENGGTIDEETCTCTCQGDDLHGWMGDTCTETYGYCQPGAGTGNRVAAEKCTTTNECASANTHHACAPTDMCCLTDFGGVCCPFEYSCNCGVGNCKCVPPPSAATDAPTKAPVYRDSMIAPTSMLRAFAKARVE